MHKSSMKRMEWFVNRYLQTTKKLEVLDVGSYDVNGCYKELFKPNEFNYVGLDMEKGPNVDLVPFSPYEWVELKKDSFDVVISGQAMEHIEFFWVTVAEMVRVTKEGGLICIIAPNGFSEHRYPVDCWRFFTDGMIALAKYLNLEIVHAHTNSAPSVKDHDWYSEDCGDSMLIAKKPYSGEAKIINFKNYKCVPEDHQRINNDMKNYKAYKESISSKQKENDEKVEQEIEPKGEAKKQKIEIIILIRKAAELKNKTLNRIRRALGKQA